MGSCDICLFSEEHGHLPPKLRLVWHCPVCHVSGKGHGEIHCHGSNGGCGRTFGSEQVFTAHQVGDSCRDPIGFKKTGERRFKTVERRDLMVWVRNETSGTQRFSAPMSLQKSKGGTRHRTKAPVAAERRDEHRSEAS